MMTAAAVVVDQGEVAALELLDGRINVKEDGCTGCGVCQHDCPTMPRSITVIPKSARPHG